MAKSKRATAPTVKPVSKSATVTPIHKIALVPKVIYQDCVDDLRDMLAAAESGELIGFAIAAMYKGRDYIVNAAGEADESPTFSRGMVKALDDYFAFKVYK